MYKKCWTCIVSKIQTAYANKRFIGEAERLINDLLEICDRFSKGCLLVTNDVEKAFDSVDHNLFN